MAAQRLGPEDWCDAALDALAAGGVEALVVERLAEALGVSKGSFYWHFANREALLEAAVLRWERVRTEEIIAALGSISDPADRLRQLFRRAFGKPRMGRIEAALVLSRDHPAIAPVLRRVTKRRVRFLADAFLELGLDARTAAQRARITYGAYIGLFVVRFANPAAVPSRAGSLDVFVDDLLDLLVRA